MNEQAVVLSHKNGLLYRSRRSTQKAVCRTLGPAAFNRIYYRASMGRAIHLDPPTLLSEKICWLKLFYYPYNKEIIKCSDKASVRDYLTERGFGKYLPTIHGIYDDPEEVNWDKLPQRFVLKCSHGCGYNIIVLDKNRADRDKINKLLKKWQKDDFGYYYAELHYNYSDRKIICEEYIDSESKLPDDYKVYCFNGKAELILKCMERDTGETKKLFYDMSGNPMDIGHETDTHPMDINSDLLKEMKTISESIAENFALVRVDFYRHHGQLKIGELSYSLSAGYLRSLTPEGDRRLGAMLDISELMKKK